MVTSRKSSLTPAQPPPLTAGPKVQRKMGQSGRSSKPQSLNDETLSTSNIQHSCNTVPMGNSNLAHPRMIAKGMMPRGCILSSMEQNPTRSNPVWKPAWLSHKRACAERCSQGTRAPFPSALTFSSLPLVRGDGCCPCQQRQQSVE